MTPRTARGHATRARIVAAAREVFADRGFAATRMGDVAHAAGVAHGTVYTYFDAKDDVLLAVLDEARADLLAAMAVPTVRDPYQRIEATTRAYLDAYRRHASVLRVAHEASPGDERISALVADLRRMHVARVAIALRRMQADGLARGDLDPVTAAAALTSMVEGFAWHWLARGEPHEDSVVHRTLMQLWVRGLGMPENPTLTREWAAAARRREGR